MPFSDPIAFGAAWAPAPCVPTSLRTVRLLDCYLDYAATSAIRPPQVSAAMVSYMEECGASPGRGGHQRGIEASRRAFQCRKVVGQLLGLPGDLGRLAFTQNATQALNTALRGLLGPGDVLVVSQFDHNSVLRTAASLEATRDVTVRIIPGDPSGAVDLDRARMLLDGASVLSVNMVSNVLGTVLPLQQLAQLAHAAGALVVADAAQAVGHLADHPAQQGADLIAVTGHKGMLGPQGTGGLWVRDGIEIEPLLAGGTGGDSRVRSMPDTMPDRLEAGTGNAPGLAGLAAGCEFVLERTVAALHAEGSKLKARLFDGLSQTPGVRVLSPPAPEGVGIVTFLADDLAPGELAQVLDRDWGIMCRAGFHCAPEVHKVLGTFETGAVRMSVGWATQESEVDYAIRAVDQILKPTSVAVG